MPLHVWVDETRPRNQGLLTAWELAQHGVPHTLIADNAGGHLMQQRPGRSRASSAPIARARNGDVCNKIGTYLKALAARDNDVPFYVAVPASSIDWTIGDGARFAIEERSADEVRTVAGRVDGKPARVRITDVAGREPGVRRHAGAARHRLHHRARRGDRSRDAARCAASSSHREADERARPDAGHVGQRQRAQRARPARHAVGHAVRRARRPTTPSSSPPTAARARPARADDASGGCTATSSRARRDVQRDRPHALAVLHVASRCCAGRCRRCTTRSCSRTPTRCRAPSTRRSAAPSSRRNVVAALRGGSACLMANHGMVALGASLAEALRIAAEIETLASQYWHACQLGSPHVLDGAELERVRARFESTDRDRVVGGRRSHEHQRCLGEQRDDEQRQDLQHVIEQGERERRRVGDVEQARRREHAGLERADLARRRRDRDRQVQREQDEQAARRSGARCRPRTSRAGPSRGRRTRSASATPTRAGAARGCERRACRAMKRANHERAARPRDPADREPHATKIANAIAAHASIARPTHDGSPGNSHGTGATRIIIVSP